VSWNLYTAPVGGAATLVPSCYCGYGIDYEGDYGLTWSMVKFAGSCADEQLRSVFYGNGPEAMPEPCMLWDDAASNGNGQWMGGQDWPSGTRFDIQWGEAAPCTLELDCSQEPSHDHEEWD